MKNKILLSILVAMILNGCSDNVGDDDNDIEVKSSSESSYDNDDDDDDDDDDDSDNTTGNISYHNQGASCLTCHASPAVGADGEDFYSGGTVYTALNGTLSSQYASGYTIRLLLNNNQSVNYKYDSEGGTANSYTEDSRVLSYPFTAQVVNSSGSVVNASAVNSHNSSRLNCNSCHTSTGNNGATGRITSYYLPTVSEATTESNTSTPTTPVAASLNFVDDVYPIINATCSTVGCHGDNTSNFVITNETETYSNIGSYITPNGVDSLLLQKASGSVNHGGGIILATSSSDYATIRDWIDSNSSQGTVTQTPTTPTPTQTTLSFASDVLPALETGCKACHGGSGNFRITTASATYTNINSFSGINTTTPENSSLLTKSIGVSHGGGGIWTTSTSGYITVKDWISQGAINN